MAILVLRTVKGTPLTNSEVDGNFSNINSEVGVVNSNVGVLSSLTTSQKSNIVAAINEIAAEATSNAGITGGTIANVLVSNVSIISGAISNVLLSNVSITSGTANNIGLSNVNVLNSTISNTSITGSILTNSSWQGNVIGITYTDAKVANVANTAPIGASINGNLLSITLLDSGVTAATYGSAVNIPTFTVDSTGRITSASNLAIAPGGVTEVSGATGNVTIANTAPISRTTTGNTVTISHLDSGVTAATYGNATLTPVIVVNATGHITSVSNVLHTVANSSITGNIMNGQLHPTGVTAATYGNARLAASIVINQQGRITSASNVAILVANSSITGNIMASQLHPTGVTAATYGNATNIPSIVIDQQGRITSASNVSVTAGITLTDQTTTASTQYILMNSASSGSQSTANVSTTKLYFVPSTGTLNATVFNSLSDVAVKENINPVSQGLDTISKLMGVEFEWKENGRKSAGVIAQDIESIIPHLVDTDSKTGLKSVNYSGIIAYLIQSIKELNDRLKKYESR